MSWNVLRDQCVSNRVPKLSTGTEYQNAAGFYQAIRDPSSHKCRQAARFLFKHIPLYDMNLAFRAVIKRHEYPWRAELVPGYQRIRHGYDIARAPPAFSERYVVRTRMVTSKISDALGVCVAKRIDRLILIANHSESASTSNYVQKLLFCPIEILVFVDQYMVVRSETVIPGFGAGIGGLAR